MTTLRKTILSAPNAAPPTRRSAVSTGLSIARDPETQDLSGLLLDGRYRLIEKIGEGGMGSVYAADQSPLGRRVAVKLLHEAVAGAKDHVERFFREARAAASIIHENVVKAIDLGCTEDGRVYLVMELLAGENLEALLTRQTRLSWPATREILVQVARGVGAAHARGLVHRDLKPANIFLSRDRADTITVKVLDFGLARRVQGEPILTAGGMLLGTPHYMSPEQATGKHLDQRADIFALGIVAFEMLTGRVPFEDDNILQVMWKQANGRIPRPRDVAPDADIPAPLERALMRALAHDREDRYPSMAEFEAALDRAGAGSIARPDGARPRRRQAEHRTTRIWNRRRTVIATQLSLDGSRPTPEQRHTMVCTLPAPPPRRESPPTACVPSPAAPPRRAAPSSTPPASLEHPLKAAWSNLPLVVLVGLATLLASLLVAWSCTGPAATLSASNPPRSIGFERP